MTESNDDQRVAGLAECGCSDAEIAMILKTSVADVAQQFAEPLHDGRARQCETIRRTVYKAATDGNMTPLGWFWKQDFSAGAGQGQQPATSCKQPAGQGQQHATSGKEQADAEIERRIRALMVPSGTRTREEQAAELLMLNWQKQRHAAERDLAEFVRQAWQVLEPERELAWSWHYDLMCEYLTLVRQRRCRRLLINVPPRTAKSTIATICFPCWVWATEPGHCFLAASYSRDLSNEHSVKRRQLIASPWYQAFWGAQFTLSDGPDTKAQFENDHRGQMIATSVGATLTGRGGDTLIVDDPISAGQALSEAERSNANDWFDQTLRSRLNDPATGAMVVIMQRLHERDLTGFLLEAEPGAWEHLRVPLVEEAFTAEPPHRAQERRVAGTPAEDAKDAEERQGQDKNQVQGNEQTQPNDQMHGEDFQEVSSATSASSAVKRYFFPRSKRIYERAAGEVLLPERYPPEVVAELQSRRLVFAGQYQQRPAPLEGNLVRRQDVHYYGGVDPVTGEADEALPEKFDVEVISADCTFKELETSDYVAIGYIGVKGRKRYVLDVVNAHLGLRATEEAIRRMLENGPSHGSPSVMVNGRRLRSVSAVLIEDAANGPAIVERLRTSVPAVIAVNPEGGKLARFVAMQPEWEAGDWYVDRNAAWTGPLIEQLTLFPNAANDDMCDMLSQASIWLRRYCATPAIVQFWREERSRK